MLGEKNPSLSCFAFLDENTNSTQDSWGQKVLWFPEALDFHSSLGQGMGRLYWDDNWPLTELRSGKWGNNTFKSPKSCQLGSPLPRAFSSLPLLFWSFSSLEFDFLQEVRGNYYHACHGCSLMFIISYSNTFQAHSFISASLNSLWGFTESLLYACSSFSQA